MIPGWKVSEMNAVRAWYGKTPIEHLARQIRRTPEEVKAAAAKLLQIVEDVQSAEYVEPKPRKKRRPLLSPRPRPEPRPRIVREPKPKPEPKLLRWSDDEIATLKAIYPRLTNGEIAQRMGRNVHTVALKASQLGLRKDPQFLSDYATQRALRRRTRLVQALREAKDYLRSGDHLAALMRIDDAIDDVGGCT